MVFNATYIGTSNTVFAFIRATYPAGYTCTCSNGSKTIFAEDTSGSYAFGVPTYGQWTISCPGTSVTPRVVNIPSTGEGMSYTASLS